MRFIISFYLGLFISGFPATASLIFAAPDQLPPVVRHAPPSTLYRGGELKIEGVVEEGRPVASVFLWVRGPGTVKYERITMTRATENSYEGRIELSDLFRQGIEYYIEVLDEAGNKGTDGDRSRPYFVTVLDRPIPPIGNADPTNRPKQSFWKNPWLWAGAVVVAIVGAIALASSGGKKSPDTGTITVE